ncbi:MAG: hypothetical protein ACX93N_09955 [Pseudohaliea sp.]
MTVNWQNLAVASSCLLENERLCGRKTFIDEASLVRVGAQFIQASTQFVLDPEHNHPDLPGNQRFDLLGRSERAKPARFLAEAKWIRSGGGVRNWPAELTKDIFRLESVITDVESATERALIVGGIRRSLEAKFLNVTVRAGGGMARVPVLPHILQPRVSGNSYPYNQVRVPIRECTAGMKQFWFQRAQDWGGDLPISYQCSLAGRHRASRSQDSVEVWVWLIRRSRNRGAFDAVEKFGCT